MKEYSCDRVVPESCCLQKVPLQEIYPCHSDLHGVTRCQIVRCASGSDQLSVKEPSEVLLLAYSETALIVRLKLQTSVIQKQKN